MRRNKGRLFVVSAPSGAGKTSLCRELVRKMLDLGFSVSYTTRPPRPGEENDRDYSFVDEARFMQMAERGDFLEWARVHGACYGTSRGRVMKAIEGGMNVLLDIDVQGAGQIRGSFEDAVFIFILPPSRQALEDRLRGRRSDSPEQINKRLRNAAGEIREYLWYDYVIINDEFQRALMELEAVVTASGLGPGSIDPSWVGKNFSVEDD